MARRPRLVIQADDFSGAAEVGQAFAAQGFTTDIVLGGPSKAARGSMNSPDVLVLDTHTRGEAPTDATTIVTQAFADFTQGAETLFFKKIDSLWRGNIAAEVSSLSALGYSVVLAGALPQLQRTVVDGKPLVGGEPLAGTNSWQAETGMPPTTISGLFEAFNGSLMHVSLATLRSGGLAAVLGAAAAGNSTGIVIIDGETESDLQSVADAFLALHDTAGTRLALAGTGGLAEALSQSMAVGIARNAQHSATGSLMEGRRRQVLAAVGSASPAARQQLAGLERNGFHAVRLDPATLKTEDP
ncbi:MAG TPA: four-carbon acid sugar kinase family protein, partial [Paenarthrobacter sp.]|nr:four-carbon acid sugar kinase family protein [Paenarthrobacter sp.]